MKKDFRKFVTYYKEIFSSNEVYKLAVFIIAFFVAILSVDIINVPTKLIEKYNIAFLSIILIGIFLIILIWLIHNHIIDLVFKVKSVNIVDRILPMSFVSTTVSLILLFVFNQEKIYKIVLLLIFIAFIFITTVIRWIRFQDHSDNLDEIQNIYDLKDVFNNNIQRIDNQPILINEKAVDYDLFNRGHIIDHLSTSIEACSKSNTSFVIGLEGSWGSGKTTILNNVKKRFEDKNNIVIIDDFDMWACGTQEALLTLMLEAILRNTDIKYSNWSSREIIKNVGTAIVDNSALGGMAKGILFQSNPESNISNLKNHINKYLKSHNKKIVFFIDNIDRADAKNIIFLFKLIGTIFDLDNIVYVLSYDRERINNILQDTLDIDPHYIEKIVQQEIKIPKFNTHNMNRVLKTCLYNLLITYGVYEDDLSKFDFILNFIVSNTKDIRFFKRLVNSVFSITFYNNYFYKPDLLAIETIKFFDIELYEEISSNHIYFINCDFQYDMDVYRTSFNIDEFNKNAKKYFDGLFQGRDESYKELLSNLFNYVYNYTHNYDIRTRYGYNEVEQKSTSMNSRINSAKYFDLYFSYSTNEFLNISTSFNNMLDLFNMMSINEITSYFIEVFNNLSIDVHKEWFEKLYLSRDSLPQKIIYPLMIGIFEIISKIDKQTEFFALNAEQRALALLASLFNRLEDNEALEFVNLLKTDYSKLYVVDNMRYWCKDESNKNRLNLLIDTISEMCERIKNNSINLYEDDNYYNRNIWSYYRYLKDLADIDENSVIKDYISVSVSDKYIYRFLRDLISSSMGSFGYSYFINRENINILLPEKMDVQLFIDVNPPQNDSEKFVKEIYEAYLSDKTDDFGEKGVVINNYFDFIL